MFTYNNAKRKFSDKPWNNVYICKLTLDKEILQWHAIYRMHNNIKSIGVEYIVCVLHTIHKQTREIELRHVKYPWYSNAIRMVGVIILIGQTS